MPTTLTITMTEDGQINVSGPIDNKILTFGLLECAKEAVTRHHQNNERRVQPASFVPPIPPIKG